MRRSLGGTSSRDDVAREERERAWKEERKRQRRKRWSGDEEETVFVEQGGMLVRTDS